MRKFALQTINKNYSTRLESASCLFKWHALFILRLRNRFQNARRESDIRKKVEPFMHGVPLVEDKVISLISFMNHESLLPNHKRASVHIAPTISRRLSKPNQSGLVWTSTGDNDLRFAWSYHRILRFGHV